MVISGPEYQELVKSEPRPTVGPYHHNGALPFAKAPSRRPFVDERKGPNENRFSLLDSYDKSTYLTNVRRPKMNIHFSG